MKRLDFSILLQGLWLIMLVACTNAPAARPALDAGPIDAGADVQDAAGGVAGDTSAPVDVEWTACQKACARFDGCAALAQAMCVARCEDPDPCGSTCVTDAKTCEDAADCLGSYTPVAKFSEGPYGHVWRELADEFELPLLEGPWSLQEHFNGRDSYVFFLTAADFQYATQLWKSSVKNWLKGSHHNVHYFFLSYADAKGGATAQKQVDTMQKAVASAVGKLDPFSQCLWGKRIHFVQDPVNSVGGSLLDVIKSEGGVAHLGIDRFQRWRQVGLMSLVGASAPDLSLIDYEVRHWNFEWDREAALAKQPQPTLVPVHAAKDGAGFDVELDFPPAAEMAKYDTMQFDLTASCKDHKDENCSEWDYISAAWLCERFQSEGNQDLPAACQAPVAEVAAVAEKSGVCAGGITPCKADAECGAGLKCQGYVAPVQAVQGVAAETKACTCTGIDGANVARSRSCKGDGKAFGACQCGCPLEIGRWITPYHREGRWVSDATPFLAYLSKGGKQRISLDAANFPMVDFTVRLSNSGKGLRPVKLVPLFEGGGFGATYNDKYKPLIIDIPATTKKVGLFAFITGHGWGAEKENCAEFCNHTHHFGVNGKEFVKDQPVVGSAMGCAEQVDQGDVPNQFGTWNIGRGGWCPGMDVKPFEVDVTEAAKIGSSNTLTYKGLFNGANYQPEPSGQANGGFGANINMHSWLVLYE
jgi:hypothetical protein